MPNQYASRAGEKLAFALTNFELNVTHLVCADFGSSQGGFVDCLLKNGATRVYAVETGYGVLAWTLRQDPRVVVLERTNAMHVKLPQKVDIITIDTSWTKQTRVIPNAMANLKPEGKIISLIKPHYEIGQARLVESESLKIARDTVAQIQTHGLRNMGFLKSPLLGGKGENAEYLALFVLK